MANPKKQPEQKLEKPEKPPKPPKKKFRWVVRLVILLLFVMGAGGAYLLILTHAANKGSLSATQQAAFLEAQGFEQNRLIIPKLTLSEQVSEGIESLEHGLWHRFPERGNPKKGGNTIVAGHRYVFAWLPTRVVEQSRFYNLDKLEVGDAVYMNWEGKQYEYKVKEKKNVTPNESTIEATSISPKLTIYTCTLKGEADGRIVLIAEPVKR